MTDGFTNRLIKEKSPYLLQHAHNPVDWYPWGKEAFEEAVLQDKPIFLSIGYATCHWCHVMESESFENLETAKLLNDTFVNIKVDREELPEVDSVYMDFAQALMASAGGWPLNLVLTPEQKPFFAITYLPPKTRKGLMGLDLFTEHIQKLWRSDQREHLIEQADKLVDLFATSLSTVGKEMPTEAHILLFIETLLDEVDPLHGGTKGAPKFPMGYLALFLLEHLRLRQDSRVLFYVELTLNKMAQGGIYDHVSGGFCRYSTDAVWMIPHFEKMLADNAIIARAYLEASKYTKKNDYLLICQEILDYLVREMQLPSGGFCSAEDADIDGKEGLFYTWTQEEIASCFNEAESELFCHYFGVTSKGNFDGRSVLHMPFSLQEYAEATGVAPEKIQDVISRGRSFLLEKRRTKKQPFKDDKVSASWNGLVIDSLIHAATTLGSSAYEEAALRCAGFIKETLWKGGELFHRFRDGETRFSGGLDDYAFLSKAALSLFTSGCGTLWLEWAIELVNKIDEIFKSPQGACYQTSAFEILPIRKCEFYDGSEPSGNAVYAESCMRLYQITSDVKYLNQAEDVLRAVSEYMEAYPLGASYHMSVLQRYLDKKAVTVIVALDEALSLKEKIRQRLGSLFSSYTEVIWKPYGEKQIDLLCHLEGRDVQEKKTTVYLCAQGKCLFSSNEEESILRALEEL